LKKYFKEVVNFKTIQMVCITITLLIVFTLYFYVGKRINTIEPDPDNKIKSYQLHYAFVCDEQEDEFWQSIYQSIKEEGRGLNIWVEQIGERYTEKYTAVEQMKIAIASKVDGILVYPSKENIDHYIALAAEKGIPVITVLNDCITGKRNAFVGINNYTMGKEYGDLIMERVKEMEKTKKSKESRIHVVILMDESAGSTGQKRILSSIQETIDSDQISLTPKFISQNSTNIFGAEEVIRDLLISKEKMPDILISLSAVNTLCMYQSVVDYNQVGEITLIGTYGSKEVWEAVEKNIIYAVVTIDGEELGKKSVQALYEYQTKQVVNEYQTVDTYVVGAKLQEEP